MAQRFDSDSVVYTDVMFERTRARHYRITTHVCFLLIALNGLGWGTWGLIFNAEGPIVVHFPFGILGLIGAAVSSKLTLRLAVHAVLSLAFIFMWTTMLVIEGIPGLMYPVTVHWWFLALAVGSILLFFDSPVARVVYVIVALASFLICEMALIEVIPPLPIPATAEAMFPSIRYGVHVCVFLGILAFSAVFVGSISSAEAQLGLANKKLESLIESMLPQSVAARLRSEGTTFADDYKECSVLFVDLVGFTKLTTQMAPRDLVSLLDEIYSRFDDLTQKHGLEKIQTIGDGYLAAAGVPVARLDHAQACIALAIDIRAVIREYAGLNVRIGVNSGSLIAGVIGKRNLRYDLWGDTVNTASRMESHGVVDGIQLSERTAKLVEHDYVLTARGAIDVKGKGPMSVYLVEGKRISMQEPANHAEA